MNQKKSVIIVYSMNKDLCNEDDLALDSTDQIPGNSVMKWA